MKRCVAIILAAIIGAVALQFPSAANAQKRAVYEGGGAASRAEALQRAPLFPNAEPVEPALTCPLLEGYPDCHSGRRKTEIR
jgi:hypothetical protein